MAGTAIFRCDASPAIGAGHLVRCISLALALAGRGWACRLLALPGSKDFVSRLANPTVEIVESDDADDPVLLRQLAPSGCELAVVDSYRLGAAYLRKLAGWAARRLVLEDIPGRELVCEVLLDPTIARAPGSYAQLVGPGTMLLLGPGYAPLRPQFAAVRRAALERHLAQLPLQRVMLAFGGTPQPELICTVLEGCARSRLQLELHIVGSGAQQPPSDMGAARIVQHGATASVHELMRDCDLAIGAAGGMAWERCCLGLPALVVEIADNQRDIAARLARGGAAISLGEARQVTADAVAGQLLGLAASPVRRIEMSRAAAAMSDGLGAARVAGALSPRLTRDGSPVYLRPASMDDAELMFRWQQVPQVRRFTPNPQPPTWSVHFDWLSRRLANPRHGPFSMIVHNGVDVGVLRLDAIAGVHWERQFEPGALQISILVDPAYHGKGIAQAALAAGRDLLPAATFYAEVLPGNDASHALFRAADYATVTTGLYISTGRLVDPQTRST